MTAVPRCASLLLAGCVLLAATALAGGDGSAQAAAGTPRTPGAADAAAASGGAGAAARPAATGTHVVLLGTAGGPVIRADRAQSASLVVVGDRHYLVDCGDGCVTQLKRAGVEAPAVGQVFVTHLHLDHVAGLAALGAFAWTSARGARIAVQGPPGTAELVRRGQAYLAPPELLFVSEVPGMGSLAQAMSGRDLDVRGAEPREVFADGVVRVLAVENTHFAHLEGRPFPFGAARSYSYRFETPDRVVVFSGDTGPSAALERLARDADLLVTEIMDVDGTMALFRARRQLSEAQLGDVERQMRAKHLTPQDVGRLASVARVRQVVLSHDASAGAGASLEELSRQVREIHAGPVAAGRDLQAF